LPTTTQIYTLSLHDALPISINSNGFPHDFLKWYSIGQAELINPDYSFSSTALISQMIRLNYSFDSRYMLTVTGRRDGFSGFGSRSEEHTSELQSRENLVCRL